MLSISLLREWVKRTSAGEGGLEEKEEVRREVGRERGRRNIDLLTDSLYHADSLVVLTECVRGICKGGRRK